MPIRNHVTRIQMKDAVAKGENNVDEKAVAESKQAPQDPEAQKKAVQDSTKGYVDGNGSGVAHMAKGSGKEALPQTQTQLDTTEKAAAEARKAEDKPAEKTENKDEPGEAGLQVTHPASSKEQGGAQTTKDVGPKSKK